MEERRPQLYTGWALFVIRGQVVTAAVRDEDNVVRCTARTNVLPVVSTAQTFDDGTGTVSLQIHSIPSQQCEGQQPLGSREMWTRSQELEV